MDHYTVFPQDGMSAITEFGPQFDPNEQYLASSFELADHNFQPVIAPTEPNVMTALNGTDHGWVYNNLEPGATQPLAMAECQRDAARRARSTASPMAAATASTSSWVLVWPREKRSEPRARSSSAPIASRT
jgi:hypothetical protein